MTTDRRIILECRIGSHLYGTNRPDSDEDFSGIFLPSTKDFLGMDNCPSEWSMGSKKSTGPRNEKGDVDRKFYSLRRFLHLAAEGQPGQLEFLFAPPEMIVSGSKEWHRIIMPRRELFLSRKGVAPFVGFALSQAHKATMKGETLNLIREIIAWGSTLLDSQLGRPLIDNAARIEYHGEDQVVQFGTCGTPSTKNTIFDIVSYTIPLRIVTNMQGFKTFEIGGRNYDVKLKTKVFLDNLKTLESRYGTRSKAAAESGLDHKSIAHAHRLMGEAEEFLSTGKITLPRPPDEVAFLKSILNKELPADYDHFARLTAKIDRLRQDVEPSSPLPEEPDHKAIGELCLELHLAHLNGGQL